MLGDPQLLRTPFQCPWQSHHLISSYHPDVPGALGSGRWGRKEILVSQASRPRWGIPPARIFSLCAVGSLKATTCFWVSSCTWPSLSGLASLWWRDQNSGQQFSSLFLLAMYCGTQSLGLSNGCGVARHLGLALCLTLLVSWDWLLLGLDAMAEGASGCGVSDCLTISSSLGVSSRFSQGSAVASWASLGSGSFLRSTASSTGVGDILGLSYMGPSGETSSISSPSRYIRGVIHLWRSHATLHRTLGDIPNLSALWCIAQANVKVSSCLVTQKYLVPGKSTWGRKSWWPSPQMLHVAFHHPDSFSWAAGSWKAMACHQVSCRAWAPLSLLWILYRVL